VRTPKAAIDIHGCAIRHGACGRRREHALRAQNALRLIEFVNKDGAGGRIGKVQPFAVRAGANAVGDAHIANMAPQTIAGIHRIQTALRRAFLIFDHRSAPEPSPAVDTTIVETDSGDNLLGSRQPLDRARGCVVQCDAAGKGCDQAVIVGYEAK
jgi:hypothetical protein